MLRNFTLTLLLGFSVLANAGVQVASKGQAAAEIVIDKDADATVKFAAEELQGFIEKISGAKLPVLNAIGNLRAKIFLGVPETSKLLGKLSETYKDDLKLFKGNDGYAVRTAGSNIYIFAATPKGVLNGVYNFLDRNTDIIWARGMEDCGTIYSANPDLDVQQSDYVDVPKFLLRGWHICSYPRQSHELTELWMIRNRCNFIGSSAVPELLEQRRKHGFIVEFGGGHNLNNYFLPPEKYARENPDFYAFLDGKRRPEGHNQLCFTNEKMIKEFINVIDDKIKNAPAFVKTFNVMIEDNWNLCECPDCKKPIKLEDGKTVEFSDEAFRSTQFFIFLNKVAEAVYEKYPDKEINSFGYYFTAIPPRVKLFKTINVRFCPYVKNDKETVENTPKWKNRTEEWVKITPNLIWREYYGCASDFPRQLSDVAARDLQYISKLGIKRVFAEYIPDADTKKQQMTENWDASGMEFWLISNLYWDPYQDLEKLREKYINRTYHEAAPAMAEYYRLIHEAWYGDKAPSHWNDSAVKSAGFYIIGKGHEKPCREALEKAEKMTADPRIKKLIKRNLDYFNSLLTKAASQKTPAVAVPFMQTQAMPDFKNEIWKNAASIESLKIMDSPDKESAFKTVINIFHDRKNLYLRIKCSGQTPESLYALPAGQKRDTWPKGDHIELFFDGDKKQAGGYYHLAFDFRKNIYDAICFDTKWDCNWELATETVSDGWHAVAKIELKSLGIDINQGGTFKGLFYRMKNGDPKEHGSWGGGVVHAPTGFGDITLNFE